MGADVKRTVREGIVEVKKMGAGDDHPPKIFYSKLFTTQKFPTILIPTINFPFLTINPTITNTPTDTIPKFHITPINKTLNITPKFLKILNITNITTKNPIPNTIFIPNHKQNTPKKQTNQQKPEPPKPPTKNQSGARRQLKSCHDAGGCQGRAVGAGRSPLPLTVPPAAMASAVGTVAVMMSAGNKKISLHCRTN